MKKLVIILCIIVFVSCKNEEKKMPDQVQVESWTHAYQAISALGDTLYSWPPTKKLQQQLKEKMKAYKEEPNLDNTIWFGRFMAYAGEHRRAIEIYSKALLEFPNNSRLLRHRGHRYITVREFDKAIADLELAAKLIDGKENKVEQDGIPNEKNIPVSSMHGNIYYHLGLAHYLNRNMPAALEAYKQCLNTSPNPDNVVSATHWIYMIQRRLARPKAAEQYLKNISSEMNVIENHSYYKACLFYKGELDLEDVYRPEGADNPSNSALKYAVGNWYWYNGQQDQAKGIYNSIVSGKDWASFGFIAAETDLAKPYNSR